MKKIRLSILVTVVAAATLLYTCKKKDGTPAPGINIFSLADDKQMGEDLKQSILQDPKGYPLLDSVKYVSSYNFLNNLVKAILDTGNVEHRNDFNWEVKIIKNDTVLNAFCAPGGKIYVFTGLIKYLDNEDQLAGVLGHEIAHASRRHVTQEMTRAYGLTLLKDVLLGKDSSKLADIAAGLVNLKFSREFEAEADEFSVRYLCPTSYKSDGAAGFFIKISASGQGQKVPVFLSTHPSDSSRITNIQTKSAELKCTGMGLYSSRYAAFKSSLPK
ncbi:MAG: M48 family metalloprotease [Bacteroidetes bacterium]|nr:M48 family metalloprotease [Bacteroidota bacterium]